MAIIESAVAADTGVHVTYLVYRLIHLWDIKWKRNKNGRLSKKKKSCSVVTEATWNSNLKKNTTNTASCFSHTWKTHAVFVTPTFSRSAYCKPKKVVKKKTQIKKGKETTKKGRNKVGFRGNEWPVLREGQGKWRRVKTRRWKSPQMTNVIKNTQCTQ